MEANRKTRAEEKMFQCDDCNKTFTSKGYLRKHIQTVHRGEKEFVCGVCRKEFGLRGDPVIHMRIHT